MIPPGTLLGGTQVAIDGAPVIGQVDPLGRTINLGKLEGWWDPAATTGTTTAKVNDHGAWLGPAFYGPRIINVEARIDGFNPADSMATAKKLLRSISLDALANVTVTDEGETLSAAVRQEGDPLLARGGNRVVVSLSLLAPDPRRYGATRTQSTGLPTTTGGISLPLVLPLSIGATINDGAVLVTNGGDMESFPVFTVRGPCPPWTITDPNTGRQLSSLETIAAGRSLIIDTAARTALLDGTSNRVVTGTWPRLLPGDNTFIFNATSYQAASRLSVTYRSARR